MNNRDPDNSQNVLIAIALSMVVLFTWQYFYAGPKVEQERIAQQTAKQPKDGNAPSVPAAGTTAAPGTPATPGTPGGSAPNVPGTQVPGTQIPGTQIPGTQANTPVVPPSATATRESVLAAGGGRVGIDTPSLRGSIGLKGGRIDDLVLVKYREKVDPKSPNVVLFSPAEAPQPYFAEFGWVSDSAEQKVPDRETVWTQKSGAKLTPASPVTLAWDNGSGLKFERTIAVDENYMFTVTDRVENTGAAAAKLYPYARIFRYGTPLVQGYYILHEGLIGVAGEQGLQEITYTDARKPDKSKQFESVTGGWLGMTDKYWASALIPDQKTPFRARFTGTPSASGHSDTFQTDYLLPVVALAQGQSQTVKSNLYAGAKKVELVEGYQDKFGIKQFDLMIDWGWFYFITKPLFYLIDWLYNILGNFGLAILAVTVIVKAAFYPLANKSYESMAKMKKLQPEMERLRERYKDDKARQQQELMKLYQEEKINPLAGCLPILLQIPVFFALYKVLFVTIDMRHAPFFGWIKDLSAPDPTSIFNLFGLLPFAVPEYLHIGAWAIIMGITMWVQMQLNPKQPDPTQQMVFNWMPVLFTFLLATFPAGLVIYWAWNNLLSIAQQWMIMKRQGAEIPLMDNIKSTFAPVGRLLGVGAGKDKK